MPKSLTEMAANIVQSLAARNVLSPEEISSVLRSLFETLQSMQLMEESASEIARQPVLTETGISTLTKRVTCLECGNTFKQLTRRHLQKHGLNLEDYRRKYGFPTL